MNPTDGNTLDLLRLKGGLPASCTQSNLLKLQIAFIKYKDLVKELGNPGCLLLELKINAISQPANSWRESKYCFKEAVACFHQEIERAVDAPTGKPAIVIDHTAFIFLPVSIQI